MREANTATPSARWFLLGQRDFLLLWAGALVSNAGSWMHRVASAWVIYQITGSAVWLGIDALASGLTTGFLLPWGGVVADRTDRRRVLIVGNVGCAVAVLLLAGVAFAGHTKAWHIVAISVATGVATAFNNPASSALLPNIVGVERVADAISLNSIQFNAARVVGPIVGGFMLLRFGAAWCFAANAMSFVVAAIALFALRYRPDGSRSDRKPFLQEVIHSLRLVGSRGELLGALAMIVAIASCAAPLIVLLPPLVKDSLRLNAGAYSTLVSAFGAGAIVGVIGLTRWANPSRQGWPVRIGISIVLLALAQASLPLIGSLPIACVPLFLGGALFVGSNVVLGTFLVQHTPDEYRGRVSSFQALGFRAAQPLGAFAGGLIIRQMDLRTAFISMSVLLAAAGGACVWKASIFQRR